MADRPHYKHVAEQLADSNAQLTDSNAKLVDTVAKQADTIAKLTDPDYRAELHEEEWRL